MIEKRILFVPWGTGYVLRLFNLFPPRHDLIDSMQRMFAQQCLAVPAVFGLPCR
jgi:hypothetical protein